MSDNPVSQIHDFIVSNGLLTSPVVTLLGQGEQHVNYLATENDEKLVVRAMRSDISRKVGFKQESEQYRFLEHIGILFAPRSVLYDENREIHVVSYIDGKDISVVGLNESQQEVFVQQLLQLDSITYNQYVAFCISNAITPREPQQWSVREKINIYDRLEVIGSWKNDPFAQKILGWADAKLTRYRESFTTNNQRVHFLHGDLRYHPTGGNIRVNDTAVIFIDWEMSRFVNDSVSELGDIIGSITDIQKYKNSSQRLVNLYRNGQIDRSINLDIELEHAILYNTFGGPLWSAERYLVLKAENHKDYQWYANYAKDMMAAADYYFSRSSEEWFV